MSDETITADEPAKPNATGFERKFSLIFIGIVVVLAGLLVSPLWFGPVTVWFAEQVVSARARLAGAALTTWLVIAVVSVMLGYHGGLRIYLSVNKVDESLRRALFGWSMIVLYGLAYAILFNLAPGFEAIHPSYLAFFSGQPEWLVTASLALFWGATHAALSVGIFAGLVAMAGGMMCVVMVGAQAEAR